MHSCNDIIPNREYCELFVRNAPEYGACVFPFWNCVFVNVNDIATHKKNTKQPPLHSNRCWRLMAFRMKYERDRTCARQTITDCIWYRILYDQCFVFFLRLPYSVHPKPASRSTGQRGCERVVVLSRWYWQPKKWSAQWIVSHTQSSVLSGRGEAEGNVRGYSEQGTHETLDTKEQKHHRIEPRLNFGQVHLRLSSSSSVVRFDRRTDDDRCFFPQPCAVGRFGPSTTH